MRTRIKNREPKHAKEVYAVILEAGHEGITTNEIGIITGIAKHSVKYPRQYLLKEGQIMLKQTLSVDKRPADMRGKKYIASVFQRVPINSKQLAIINAFRINRQLQRVGK